MKTRDEILDLVRGLSAMAVMLGHLRAFVLVDYGELHHPGPVASGLYFATGLGHQAVMVFFVLSGYFVGGECLGGVAWRSVQLAKVCRRPSFPPLGCAVAGFAGDFHG